MFVAPFVQQIYISSSTTISAATFACKWKQPAGKPLRNSKNPLQINKISEVHSI